MLNAPLPNHAHATFVNSVEIPGVVIELSLSLSFSAKLYEPVPQKALGRVYVSY